MSDSYSDHGREMRLWGPPGTGKTTRISAMVRDAAIREGASNVMVASFTTTAAAELGSRGLPLPKSNIGTLHSQALKALGSGIQVVNPADFNDAHPAYALSVDARASKNASLDGETPSTQQGGTDADVLHAHADMLRNRMVDRADWPVEVIRFQDVWDGFKRDTGSIDFVDMIDFALQETTAPASNATVGFFDEVQDQTPLELSLIWKWAKSMDRVVLAGDDDQMIYGFRGADAQVFRDHPVPDNDRIVLAQSHRIPAAVHRAASTWIKRVSWREEKPYAPREEEGVCKMVSLQWNNPDPLVNAIEDEVQAGRTVMLLGACGYLLDPVKHALKERGTPFHNPYRARTDWNPLGAATPGTVSARERLLAYLIPDEEMFGDRSRLWTGDDVRRWMGSVKTQGVFRRGVKEMVEALPRATLSQEQVEALFSDKVDDALLDRVLGPDLGWFVEQMTAAAKGSGAMRYAVQVAKLRGGAALVEEPRVVLGTIHSVKGGQADTVFLLPDVSVRGWQQFSAVGEGRDGAIRQFYVGMTRAKERLFVCEPGGKTYVPPLRLVEGAGVAA